MTLPIDASLDPGAVRGNYALGWFREELRDGSTVLQHGSNIDGFSCFVSFLPQHDLGLVVMNNMDSSAFGSYSLHVLVNQSLGLDRGVPARVLDLAGSALTDLAQLGRTTSAVDFTAVSPTSSTTRAATPSSARAETSSCGSAQSLAVASDAGRELHHDRRSTPSDGGASRPRNRRDPHIELVGLEAVRRTTGPA